MTSSDTSDSAEGAKDSAPGLKCVFPPVPFNPLSHQPLRSVARHAPTAAPHTTPDDITIRYN